MKLGEVYEPNNIAIKHPLHRTLVLPNNIEQ
jgi:hypothetical protein